MGETSRRSSSHHRRAGNRKGATSRRRTSNMVTTRLVHTRRVKRRLLPHFGTHRLTFKVLGKLRVINALGLNLMIVKMGTERGGQRRRSGRSSRGTSRNRLVFGWTTRTILPRAGTISRSGRTLFFFVNNQRGVFQVMLPLGKGQIFERVQRVRREFLLASIWYTNQ